MFERFTDRARQAVELAHDEAMRLNHSYIGTEHLLLGLIREDHGVAAQVLTRLGADLNRVRQQVIQLLHGYHGPRPGPVPAGMRLGQSRWKMRGRQAEIREHVEAIGSQLAAIEQRLGGGPELGDLDRQIGQAVQGKEAAAGAEDYETATTLRDQERQLLAEKAARQAEWAAAHPELSSVAEALHRLGDEVSRLRGLLDELGIEPRDGAA